MDRLTSVDGLNRILNQTTSGSTVTMGYDGRGNLTANGTSAYTYNADNMLLTGPNGVTLAYDPAGRLRESGGNGQPVTRFQYDGINLVAEYNSSNALLRRHVHGSGTDEPIVWYEGITIGSANRRYLMADERGSITAVSDSNGNVNTMIRYDDYGQSTTGIPSLPVFGRFGYTGQAYIHELGLYNYRARIYAPALGRFMQTDPIGYRDGANLYSYVRGDPANYRDPLGLTAFRSGGDICVRSYFIDVVRGDDGSIKLLPKTLTAQENCFALQSAIPGVDNFDFDLANAGDIVVTGRRVQGPPNGCIQPALDAAHWMIEFGQSTDRAAENGLDGAAALALVSPLLGPAAPAALGVAGQLAIASETVSAGGALTELAGNTYASVVTGNDAAGWDGATRALATLLPSPESLIGQALFSRIYGELMRAAPNRPRRIC